MKRKLLLLLVVSTLSLSTTEPAVAGIDLQADLNRIVVAINKFDANSAASGSVSSIAGMKNILSKNASILREIRDANAVFKADLNRAKSQIPTRDTNASPAFSTLMNLTKGYEEWLKYQEINQATGQKCMSKAKNSFTSFSNCLIVNFSKTLENERIGKMKLQSAWDAWKKWQVKFGYA
jgi:hypothetical protein